MNIWGTFEDADPLEDIKKATEGGVYREPVYFIPLELAKRVIFERDVIQLRKLKNISHKEAVEIVEKIHKDGLDMKNIIIGLQKTGEFPKNLIVV